MKVKIILNSGLILTLNKVVETEKQIFGSDKFGYPVIVLKTDIRSMLPAKEDISKDETEV